jgi:hypothetical protein
LFRLSAKVLFAKCILTSTFQQILVLLLKKEVKNENKTRERERERDYKAFLPEDAFSIR